MSYSANVIEVMIASPSDVYDERQIVREILTEWNVVNSREHEVVVMPIGWETHSSPDLGGRPQQIINDSVLSHADILVGIFWTRLGSPTGKAASGTVEEIEEHLDKGRPVMLYFSDTPAIPSSVDKEQYEKLVEFKNWAKTKGLIESYTSKDVFRNTFRRQFAQTIARMTTAEQPDFVQVFEQNLKADITPEALELLKEATKDRGGIVMHRSYIGGEDIITNNKTFNDADARSIAVWSGAKDELIYNGYLSISNEDVSKVTRKGYEYIESKNTF